MRRLVGALFVEKGNEAYRHEGAVAQIADGFVIEQTGLDDDVLIACPDSLDKISLAQIFAVNQRSIPAVRLAQPCFRTSAALPAQRLDEEITGRQLRGCDRVADPMDEMNLGDRQIIGLAPFGELVLLAEIGYH